MPEHQKSQEKEIRWCPRERSSQYDSPRLDQSQPGRPNSRDQPEP